MTRTTLALLFLGGVTLSTPASAEAQDPCPSASGPRAEAGWTAYQAGDMVAARDEFNAALTQCDNDHYARTGLGYVALRDGDTAEAAELLERVVRSEPNNVDARVGLGLARWRTGDLVAVREHFERALTLAPDHPTALEYLALVSDAEAAVSAPPDAADEAWMRGDTEAALGLYSARLDDDPLDGLAMLRLGLIRAWAGQYEAALILLDLLVDLEPTNVDGRLARARVHAWNGDLPRARDEVEEVLGVVPDNADALATLALFQSWSGDLAGSLESYDALMTIAPEHGAGRRQHAQAMAWAADLDQSIETFTALVEENPRDLDARLGLANALAVGGFFDRSIEQYDLVVRAVPDEMRALAGRTRTLMWAGRLVESERSALAALDVDNASGVAWGGLGQSYRAQGRDAAALEAFEFATRFDPTNPEIRDQLRSVRLGFAPRVTPTVTSEQDSDGNAMWTATVDGRWYASPRVQVTAVATLKDLEQEFAEGSLTRQSVRGMVTARTQLRPGWTVSAGLGAHVTDAEGRPTMWAGNLSVRTPDRVPFGLTALATSSGIDETASLASRGIRATSVTLAARWFPDRAWRVDASVTAGSYEGDEGNGRRAATLSASRRVGRAFTFGAGFRGFSFEKNLAEGYFDPDFYGIAEVTSSWVFRPLPWTVLIELAPGVQQITSDGDLGTSIRSNARVGYRIGDGRELSLMLRYSSAGLATFATGADGYSYTAITLGLAWIV
ncbi:MAG: tetratricopeptide repeat protein [Gemmatimonadota bacterium]